MSTSINRPLSLVACGVVALGLYACGGGSGSSTPSSSATTVTGSIVKGPVNGATVTIRNAATGAVLGTTTSNSSGSFTLPIEFTGDVIVEATGGSYTDEATGLNTALSSPMRSVLTLAGSSVSGVVTPLTTLAYSYAFGSSTSGVTGAAFDARATALATQFQLNGVNLATTVPVVTGSTNAYGQVLRGLSQHLSTQGITLNAFTSSMFTASSQWTAFTTQFNSAYRLANPGSSLTFAFTGNGLTVGGTGGGGGAGSCGVRVTGSVTSNGFTVPVDLNYCVQGLPGSCESGNASLSQALAGQSGLIGGVSLSYAYSATCAQGAFTITLN